MLWGETKDDKPFGGSQDLAKIIKMLNVVNLMAKCNDDGQKNERTIIIR